MRGDEDLGLPSLAIPREGVTMDSWRPWQVEPQIYRPALEVEACPLSGFSNVLK